MDGHPHEASATTPDWVERKRFDVVEYHRMVGAFTIHALDL